MDGPLIEQFRLWNFKIKGAFTNYADKILPIIVNVVNECPLRHPKLGS